MVRPLRIEFPDAFYHVMCRGNERRAIFRDDTDRKHFLVLLFESLKIYQVVLHSFILMPNHFHLLVQTRRANLSEFMRRFNISYTGWFNYRHRRCGHLYQGRYKAFLVDAQNYLLEISRYVHLNCIRGDAVKDLVPSRRWDYTRQYVWSSLPGYLDSHKMLREVDYRLTLEMVGGRSEYESFMIDGLKRGVACPFEEIVHQAILGSDAFVARVVGEHVAGGSERDQPSYRDLVERELDPLLVIDLTCKTLGVDKHQIADRYGDGVVRGIIGDMLYRYAGLTERVIGEMLGGIDYSTVNKLRSRLRNRMAVDKEAAALHIKVEQKIKEQLSNVGI